MQAKFVNMALRMVAMLTMGATQALAGAGAIKGGAARRLRQKQSTKPWQRGALSLIGVTLAAAALMSAPPAAASNGPKVYARDHAGSAWFKDDSNHVYLCNHASDKRAVAVQLQYRSHTGRNKDYWRWNWWGPTKYNGCKEVLRSDKDSDHVVAQGAQILYRVCLGKDGSPGGKGADVIESTCSSWGTAYNHEYD